MNKRDRFLAAIEGEWVDRPPRTCWTHFSTETLGGDEHAARQLVFQKEYDWDICKLVNDFQYPFPDGVEMINGPDDMDKFEPASMDSYFFREELKSVQRVIEAVGADTPVIMTVFDPLRQVTRLAGVKSLEVIAEHPQAAKRMLDAVGDSMCRYMEALRGIGCDGIYFAVNSAMLPPAIWCRDDDFYNLLMKPYELAMLEAAKGMQRFMHVHGTAVTLDRHKNYPVEVITVSDRLAGNPNLEEVREQVSCCIMGGVNEAEFALMTPAELRAQMDDALDRYREKFILAPGCTIPVWSPARQIQTLATYRR